MHFKMHEKFKKKFTYLSYLYTSKVEGCFTPAEMFTRTVVAAAAGASLAQRVGLVVAALVACRGTACGTRRVRLDSGPALGSACGWVKPLRWGGGAR